MSKLIFDPIHGYIELSKLAISIIDTPEFQRLRNIKQLGCCYYVFPGASHNRFEHSIGVAYLARKLLRNILKNQSEIKINKAFLDIIEIAGLCHDLGHGPFSHIFDDKFLKAHIKNNSFIKHEIRSCLILDYIVKKYNIKISKPHLEIIKELIHPIKKNIKPKFLYHIVANPDTGIDVDKFDYIRRDTYNIGLKYSFNYDRIIKQARVINDEIVYPSKMIYEIYELFNIRNRLHLQIYTHPVVRAVELMYIDCFNILEKKCNFSKKILNIEEFLKYTDTIFEKFIHIKEIKHILQRIDKREIYKYVGQDLIITDLEEDIILKKAQKIFKKLFSNKAKKTYFDIVTIGYKENPIKKVKFYSTKTNKLVNMSNISNLINQNLFEQKIRFYKN